MMGSVLLHSAAFVTMPALPSKQPLARSSQLMALALEQEAGRIRKPE